MTLKELVLFAQNENIDFDAEFQANFTLKDGTLLQGVQYMGVMKDVNGVLTLVIQE